MKKILERTSILKNYNFYISFIVSLISLCLSSVNFKVASWHDINFNVIGLYKFYFISMSSLLSLFLICRNNFFDKYLLSATIFAISLILPAFTSFEYTELYEYSVSFVLALILWNLYNNVKKNIKTYSFKFKIVYLILLLLYCNCIYIILLLWGLSRCVGGCL